MLLSGHCPNRLDQPLPTSCYVGDLRGTFYQPTKIPNLFGIECLPPHTHLWNISRLKPKSLKQNWIWVNTRGLQRLLQTLVFKHFQALSVQNPPRRLSSILLPVVETHWWTKSEMHSLGFNGWTDAVCPIMHFLKIAKCWPLFKPKEDLMMTL